MQFDCELDGEIIYKRIKNFFINSGQLRNFSLKRNRGVAQWLGRRSSAGGLSLIYA